MSDPNPNPADSMEELKNMLVMLEEELDGFRKRGNPNENYDHKLYRMLFTLGNCVKSLDAQLNSSEDESEQGEVA